MVVYLTSNFIAPGDNRSLFADLRKEWKEPAKVLYVPCNPKEKKENEQQKDTVLDVFKNAGLEVKELTMLGETGSGPVKDLVEDANVIYLAGGHAPSQLAFMKNVGLDKVISTFNGVVICSGAGSMNAAYNVYLMPDKTGEAADPNFVRFLDGLDLTNIQMIPHREDTLKRTLDGKNIIEDVVMPDSYGRRFYLVSDGSFFKVKNGKTTFKGKGEIIEDGTIRPLKQGTIVPFMGYFEQTVVKTMLADGYDMVFSVNKKTEVCEVYYLHENLKELFESSKLKYPDICFKLSQLVVEEEQESFLDQLRASVILKELKEKGDYVRTVHVDTENGRRAKNIRVWEVPGYPDWFLVVYIDITTFLDHDWMTDEYARTGFLERAALFISELPEDENYSLVYTNVKGFKAVNELFGNWNGDMVIFQTRDVLRKYLKPVLLGRLESDHFVLITSDDNLTDRNLREMCSQVYRNQSKEYSYEIRCGIYSIKNRNADARQLLAGAKLVEKTIGDGTAKGNRLYAYYDDTMKESYVRQRFLLSDFERALNENEFLPYYQPIVDARTGDVVSAELLIRWRHKDLGMVSPGQFIPVIESEGMISHLDSFMLDKVIDFLEKRAAMGKRSVPCAINLSRVDFYDLSFIEGIYERVKKKGIDLSMIRFEVTESAYADLESRAMEFLNKLKEEGVMILLDDFGSGMSSLSMLESFDFDIIKLDLGFIRKIGINDKAEAIIASTIRLAHLIGAKVTAEGVETEEQLKFLKYADCDYIQGYLFHKPMPEEEFIAILDGE
ncbi:EAL domain-containing protein [Butyrivibrio sp. DSM 10294]|uniref:EAL domain-containing protein n=1 Tax=Butyrivibrio sp. DSM 10294 TaxID=2972457 RepID=UPI00234F4A15|nr:EAL domain-containing protein [Butyrivibrio sp. DSM 10294]MDC7293511.1 EAL domain-containing protein [Butyrivibrio sp. DSM 10294]